MTGVRDNKTRRGSRAVRTLLTVGLTAGLWGVASTGASAQRICEEPMDSEWTCHAECSQSGASVRLQSNHDFSSRAHTSITYASGRVHAVSDTHLAQTMHGIADATAGEVIWPRRTDATGDFVWVMPGVTEHYTIDPPEPGNLLRLQVAAVWADPAVVQCTVR